MREKERLNGFYNDLKLIHQTYCQDLRFGQFITSFETWHYQEFRMDTFYLEEKEYLKRVKFWVIEMFGRDPDKEIFGKEN